jgi:hypothetical protein
MVGEALFTAFRVLNSIPKKNKEKTPYEDWVGMKPSLSYLHTYGCLAKVNIPIPKNTNSNQTEWIVFVLLNEALGIDF